MNYTELNREAALDAEARDLRVVCNCNVKARQNVAETAQAANRRVAARKAAQARRDANWNTFLLRTFCSLAGASIMCILTAYRIIPYELALIVTIAAGLFIAVNFVAYATRNRREREALAKAWKWIVQGKNKIYATCQ